MWKVLMLGVLASCGGSVVQVRDEAQVVKFVLATAETPTEAMLDGLARAGCTVLQGSVQGRSTSASSDAAECGARNDLRNKAHQLGGNIVISGPRSSWVVEEETIVMTGMVVRCPTSAELGIDEYVQAQSQEVPCAQ